MTEKKILQDAIRDHKSAIDKAERELAKLDKESTPALRHGDYGMYESGCFWVLLERDNILEVFGAAQGSGRLAEHIKSCLTSKLGNIFNDLARNAEGLKEFEVSGQYDKEDRKTLKSHIHKKNESIWLHINTGSSYFELDNATEIAHKILQEVATAKKRQGK